MEINEVRQAPEPLRRVQKFVNTRSNLRGLDLLEDPVSTKRWLTEQGFISGNAGISETEAEQLVAFREMLRGLLSAHNGGEKRAEDEISAISGNALLRVAFDPSGEPRLVPAGEKEIENTMGTLLSDIARSSFEGTWRRLKACRNEHCRWAFYDGSKNRSGAWCDMQTCGARHKMRAYRKRKSG